MQNGENMVRPFQNIIKVVKGEAEWPERSITLSQVEKIIHGIIYSRMIGMASYGI